MSGILGMCWKGYTLRAFWVMYQSKVLWEWDHTASVMSKVCFMTKPVSPTVFHPFRKTVKTGDSNGHKVTKDNTRILASTFLGV